MYKMEEQEQKGRDGTAEENTCMSGFILGMSITIRFALWSLLTGNNLSLNSLPPTTFIWIVCLAYTIASFGSIPHSLKLPGRNASAGLLNPFFFIVPAPTKAQEQ